MIIRKIMFVKRSEGSTKTIDGGEAIGMIAACMGSDKDDEVGREKIV